MMVGFVACPLLVLLQALVKTDQERIIELCREMTLAAERGDIAALDVHIAEHFDSGGIHKPRLLEALTLALTRIHIEEARLSGFRFVSESGRRARIRFRAVARVIADGQIARRSPTTWELRFEGGADGWQVIELNPVSSPGFPFGSLGALFRSIGVL
jgi:hypothetical protein